MRRPLVAKIHRDLFLAPKNDSASVSYLEEGWAEALKRLFDYYTPIVIGYGGNDGSLMGFLEKADLRGGLCWCYRAGDGEPSERIQTLVAEKKGHLVPIIGFDEFMLEVGAKLISDFDITAVGNRIEKLGKDRATRYRDEAEKLQKRIDGAANGSKAELEPARRAFLLSTERPKDWWGWELKAQAESDPIKRESIYREGLRHCKDSAELTGNFALFMTTIRKDYDEAERLFRKALELDPNGATNTSNFANFLATIRKYYGEAEGLYRKALELDPNHAIVTGSFANFLAYIRKDYYDEAERFYRKALELDPNHAGVTGNFANFLATIRKDYTEAERLYRKALELDPNHANNTANFAGFLLIRERWDEARTFCDRALEMLAGDVTQIVAEVSFYLALLAIQRGEGAAAELARLKELIAKGYERLNWSFTRHLEAMSPYLDEHKLEFYRALSDAILDEDKVAVLEEKAEWQALP